MIVNPVREKLKDYPLGSPDLARIYQSVFTSPEGQLVLEDLKINSFFYDTTADERFTEFNEGRRQMVLHIIKALEMDVSQPIDSANRESES